MTCCDFDALATFSQGLLDERERAIIDTHLDSCEVCRSVVAEYQRTLSEQGNGGAARSAASDGALIQRGSVFGRFVVIDYLGGGATGVVCAAYDAELDRKVALKVLRFHGDDAPAARQRFEREARAMARIVHPNVVGVYESGMAQERAFIAMEFMSGGTLRQWLKGAPRTPRSIYSMFMQAGRGLAAAHACGVFHRDFKPENVLVGADGSARVTDFGLAYLNQWPVDTGAEGVVVDSAAFTTGESQAALQSRLTRSGVTHGTPLYMAPERLHGAPGDARSDQFSFCVAFFEALFGEHPFAATSIVELRREIEAGAIRKVNRRGRMSRAGLSALERGLSADPARRFASMQELLDALAYDPAVWRRRAAIGLGVAALLAASVPGYLHWMRASRGPCGDVATLTAGVWDEAQRDAARKVFVAPGAASGFAVLDRRLATYLASLQKTFAQACSGSDENEQTRGERDCLLERLNDARAAISLVISGEGVSPDAAVSLANRLSPIETCVAEPRADVPSRDADEATTDQLAQELALAVALQRADSPSRALEIARRVASEARKIGDRSLLARSLSLTGNTLLAFEDDPSGAKAALREAALTAEQAGLDDLAGNVYLSLSWLVGTVEHQCEEATLWLEQAESSLMRVSRSNYHRAMLLLAQANILYTCRRQFEQAQLLLSEAEALAREVSQDGEILVKILILGSNNAFDSGHVDKAGKMREELYELSREMYGADHYMTVGTLANIGIGYAAAGRFPEAVEKLDAVREYYASRAMAQSAADMLVRSGAVLGAMGRTEEALRRFDEGLPVLRQGQDPTLYAERLLDALPLMRSLKMYDRLLVALPEVIASLEGRSDPFSLRLVGIFLSFLGGVKIDTGQLASARDLLARAQSLLGALDQEPVGLADLEFEFARLDWLKGRRREAVERARHASEAWATQLPNDALMRQRADEMEAWLASHTVTSRQGERAQ